MLRWPAALAGISMLWLAGCGPAHLPAPRPEATLPIFQPTPTAFPTHDFLLDGHDEGVQAPMYSYVLFSGQASAPAARQQYLALAQAVWEQLARPDPEQEPGPRGIAVWPVRGLDLAAMRAATVNQTWETWVDQYHYQRAQLVYDRVGLFTGSGPHLVTSLEPLGRLAGKWQPAFRTVLILDLAQVPANHLDRVLERFRQHVLENPVQRPSAWRIPALDAVFGEVWGDTTRSRFSLQTIPD